MCFPRAAALAERTWSSPEIKNYKNFFNRLKEFSQNFYSILGVNYCKNEFTSN